VEETHLLREQLTSGANPCRSLSVLLDSYEEGYKQQQISHLHHKHRDFPCHPVFGEMSQSGHP